VKADAYGHGAIPLARKFLESGGDYLGVSSLEEGIVLRQAGINSPILILGSIYPYETFSQIFTYRLTPTVASLAVIEELERLALKFNPAVRLAVHLKVDTGMRRIGISPSLVEKVVEKISSSHLFLEGIYSHLASADSDPDYTREQIKILQEIKEKLETKGIIIPFYHLANSTAILHYPEAHFNLVRPGLLLYGLFPYQGAEKEIELKPVLSLKTRIVFVKKVPPGKRISYGGTFTTKKESWIATLPIGYADGYSRSLSNTGEVLIKGKRCPVVGRVTMDMLMVEVSSLYPLEVGEEVVMIGRQGEERITIEELARKIGTISYEIICGLSKRLPRIYKG
jgi:alanine racemase